MDAFDAFKSLDIRVGQIIDVDDAIGVRKPSYKITINFGAGIGEKISCGQFPARYKKPELLGKKVVCAINLPPRKIGQITSEVLTLGLPDAEGQAILLVPERDVPIGGRMF